jgi:SAM-dependent methyltransferase
MDSDIARRRVLLNSAFYQSFARAFAATRERVQPGVERLLELVASAASVLDLGCGSAPILGRLAAFGFDGTYVGLDLSPELVRIARSRIAQGLPFQAQALTVDLMKDVWPLPGGMHFERALLFAVLHHLPGSQARLALLRRARQQLDENGLLLLSNWQFNRSPRLRARLVPWEAAGFAEGDLDPGDFLIDWRRGGRGLRYIHLLEKEERLLLCAQSGFHERQSFPSDGEGGRLSDYAVWEPA